MENYERLFAMNLQQRLKNKIVGKIFVKATRDDKLYIQITRDTEETEFKMFLDNFSEKVLNGFSTEYAAYEVLKQYRAFVREIMESRYFYND